MFGVYTDLTFLPSLVGIQHIPDKNAALIPSNNVTLHAMINESCCCTEDYDSCHTVLNPEYLNSVNRHDNCNGALDGLWNARFDIPIVNITDNEVVVNFSITPNPKKGGRVRPYVSNNITIQLQGIALWNSTSIVWWNSVMYTGAHFVLLLMLLHVLNCLTHSNLHVYTRQQIEAVALKKRFYLFQARCIHVLYMYNVRAGGSSQAGQALA